jgi:pseudaminic acid cytidylyltransferase
MDGIPLIGRTITSILASQVFDEIYVSTDDTEIAQIAVQFGASVPFLREENLADDFVTTQPVIADFLNRLDRERGEMPNYCCCVYATSFLLDARVYGETLDRLQSNGDLNYVATIAEYSHPIQRALEIEPGNDLLRFTEPEHRLTRTQDLQKRYHDAGQLYWGQVSAWKNLEPIFGERTAGYIIDSNSIVDIDSESDWMRAEKSFLFNNFRTGGNSING